MQFPKLACSPSSSEQLTRISQCLFFFKATLTALESQTEAREKEEGGELQGAIYVHHTVGHVTQVVMHLLKKCIYIREHTKRNSDEEQLKSLQPMKAIFHRQFFFQND